MTTKQIHEFLENVAGEDSTVHGRFGSGDSCSSADMKLVSIEAVLEYHDGLYFSVSLGQLIYISAYLSIADYAHNYEENSMSN